MWDVPTCSEAPPTEGVDFLLIDRLTLGLLCPVDDLLQIKLSYNWIVKMSKICVSSYKSNDKEQIHTLFVLRAMDWLRRASHTVPFHWVFEQSRPFVLLQYWKKDKIKSFLAGTFLWITWPIKRSIIFYR